MLPVSVGGDGSVAPLDVLASLVLEDGRRWGEAACGHQWADAEAVFGGEALWHFLTRPRGGSKSTDLAGVALAWLVAEASPRRRGFVVAVSEEQATEVMDAAAGLVGRTPGMERWVRVDALAMVGGNGASVRVLTSDGSSAFGKGRDTGLIVLDEFAQWPETRKMHRLWVAMLSATQKTPGLRLVILTSAGEPSHFSHEVLRQAKAAQGRGMWRVSEMPGPVPWVNHAALEAQRGLLSEAEFARLHLNQWVEEEDRLVSPEDLRAAAVLEGDVEPSDAHRYVVVCDLGVKRDPTVVVVAHLESDGDGRRVVVDHLRRWVPPRRGEVRLAQVQRHLEAVSGAYNRAPVYGDPAQFHQMRQALGEAGVLVKEYKFTTQSVGELASSLVMALRSHQLWVPDDSDLRDELLHVRLRETSPGVYRLDHDRSRHDDQAVAVGMAVHLLMGRSRATAAFRRYLAERSADAKSVRESPVAAHQRHLRRTADRARRARGAQRRSCEHRWRPDGSCAWGCGELGPPA